MHAHRRRGRAWPSRAAASPCRWRTWPAARARAAEAPAAPRWTAPAHRQGGATAARPWVGGGGAVSANPWDTLASAAAPPPCVLPRRRWRRRCTCFCVSGKVASLTMRVSRMMAKPYEYGTPPFSSTSSRNCTGSWMERRHARPSLRPELLQAGRQCPPEFSTACAEFCSRALHLEHVLERDGQEVKGPAVGARGRRRRGDCRCRVCRSVLGHSGDDIGVVLHRLPEAAPHARAREQSQRASQAGESVLRRRARDLLVRPRAPAQVVVEARG